MELCILYQIRQAFIDGWLSKEDALEGYQNGRYGWEDYLWIIGGAKADRPVGKIIMEEEK